MVLERSGRLARVLCAFLITLTVVVAGCSDSEAPRSDADVRAATGAAVRPPPEPERPRARIVFLGDSLTAGLGLPREHAVPSLIQERLRTEGFRYDVVNAGVSGDTSAGGLSRLDWSIEGDVAVLVLELGANDGLRGLPVAQLKRNLTEIITRAKQRGISVVLTGMEAPPNYGAAYTSEFRQAYRDLAEEHDVVFVPFFLDGVAGIASLNNADGIHPNAEGATIIAQRLWGVLAPLLEKHDQ